MKIRSPKDVEKLDKKIKEELGIDVRKYRNEEVVDNFVELLVFPKYAINWVIRPILFAVLFFLAGFIAIDLVHVEFILYAIIGLVLFLACGLVFGLLFLTWKMRTDIWGIVSYSLEILKSAVTDLNQVNNQITAENRQEVLGLLFKGIMHIVTIPLLSKVISEKIPVIGGLVNGLIKRILILVTNKVNFDEGQLEAELLKEEDEPKAIQLYVNTVTSVAGGLELVLKYIFRIAQIPLMIILLIIITILSLFVFLIN